MPATVRPSEPTIPHISEKSSDMWTLEEETRSRNPVIASSELAYKATNLVKINDQGVTFAAKHIRQRLLNESYTPRSWRSHPLHLCPPDPYVPSDPLNTSVLDWIFLISSLNFSFWSEKEGQPDRYGVEWQASWNSTEKKVFTGYWSLVAALNRALAEGIPITSPYFYSSEELCPDSMIAHIFRPAPQSNETVPLLKERIAIMREGYGGTFEGFLEEFQRQHNGHGTALDLVKLVTQTFPSFRDETFYDGQPVYLWKRAQILVAEAWAAFFPANPDSAHPLFPGPQGPEIGRLTMFADYRVPQILHHLRILDYPASLLSQLHAHTPFPTGCREELSLRTASIIAVERVREEILRLIREEEKEELEEGKGVRDDRRGGDVGAAASLTAAATAAKVGTVSSVLIDFYLWDLAKKVETGEDKIEGIETTEIVPVHRTRSTWY